MALGLSYLSLLVQKSTCFKPQRRMLFRHVSAQSKQQEAFTSGNHLRACGCRQKETVWKSLIFAKENFLSPTQALFVLVPVYSLWTRPLFSRCVSFPFRAVYSAMSCWFRGVLMLMEDVRCGWSPWSLMSSKCWGVAERCLLLLTGDEVFAVEEAWLTGVVLFDWFQGVCESRRELAGPKHTVVENKSERKLWCSRQLRVNR